MPSIWDMFRNTQQVRVANQPQQQPNNGPQQNVDPNGNVQQQPTGQPGSSMQLQNANSGQPQNSQQQQPGGNPQSSPLDAFTKMWETDPNAKPQADPFATPLLNLDPAKFQEGVSKLDFIGNAPQELIQKVMAGNDPQALIELMNHVGRQSFMMAGQLATASTNKAGSDLAGRFKQSLPDMFKDFMLQNEAPENPILQHPAAQQMLHMARSQIRMKEPNLSPAEVNKKAEQFLSTFASSLSGGNGQQGQNQQQQTQSKEQDWEAFLN